MRRLLSSSGVCCETSGNEVINTTIALGGGAGAHRLDTSVNIKGFSRISFSFDDASFAGQSKKIPLRPEPSGNEPDNDTVLGKLGDNDVPPFAQAPNDITGIRLTAPSSSGLAFASAMTDLAESTFVMSQYGSPVVEGSYGDATMVYHRGAKPTLTVALLQAEGSQVAAAAAPVYTTGYLFLNNEGGNFTSFTIPEALAGGDSQFEINLLGEAFDLAAGDVFDFTSFDPEGVDSFLVVGIDESEMIDPQVDMPFVIGVTTVAGSDASFVAVPLVPIPEPGAMALAMLSFLGVVFFLIETGQLRVLAYRRDAEKLDCLAATRRIRREKSSPECQRNRRIRSGARLSASSVEMERWRDGEWVSVPRSAPRRG